MHAPQCEEWPEQLSRWRVFLRLHCGKIYVKQPLRKADVFNCRGRDGSHVFSVNGAFNCQLTVTEPHGGHRYRRRPRQVPLPGASSKYAQRSILKSPTIKREVRRARCGVRQAIKLCKRVTIHGVRRLPVPARSVRVSTQTDPDGAARAFGAASDKATINIETQRPGGTNRPGAACTTRRLRDRKPRSYITAADHTHARTHVFREAVSDNGRKTPPHPTIDSPSCCPQQNVDDGGGSYRDAAVGRMNNNGPFERPSYAGLGSSSSSSSSRMRQTTAVPGRSDRAAPSGVIDWRWLSLLVHDDRPTEMRYAPTDGESSRIESIGVVTNTWHSWPWL